MRDFVLGDLRIQIAVLFGEVNGTFSPGRLKQLGKMAHRLGIQLEVGAHRLTRELALEYIHIARQLDAPLTALASRTQIFIQNPPKRLRFCELWSPIAPPF